MLGAPGPWLDALDFNTLGYGIVGLFVVTWAASAVVWKVTRLEERWAPLLAPPGQPMSFRAHGGRMRN